MGDAENQKFLTRLNGAKSSINLPKLDKAHQKQQAFMRMRCERPKPEWRVLFPPHVMAPKPEIVEDEDPIDVDVERLQQLQEHLRGRLEAEETLDPSSPSAQREAADD